MRDTIAAVATGGVRCAVGILRLSGPEAIRAAGAVFRPMGGTPLAECEDRRLVLDASHGLYVTQADIRQVQLCKGAILSGILTLLKELKVEPEEVDRVLVAGQFGKHLDPASLTGAGILPSCLGEKISYIGNSSMTGAELCLLSQAERRRAEALAQTISYVELSVSEGYEALFTKSLQFGGV